MANNVTVYMHIAPNGKKYVGITHCKPEYRWANGNGYRRHNRHFYSAIQKYGWDNFKHIILATDLSEDWACQLERIFIHKYNCTDPNYGYNVLPGGDCSCNPRIVSEETREKLRQASLGHTVSEETRKKISKSKKGHTYGPRPDDVKEKIRQGNLGRTFSEETLEKMRQAKLGKKRNPESIKKFKETMARKKLEREMIQVGSTVQAGKTEGTK